MGIASTTFERLPCNAAMFYLAAGLALGPALLLAAILAPTDPVLAHDVQVRHSSDLDRVRFALSAGFLGTTVWGIAGAIAVGALLSWTTTQAVIRSYLDGRFTGRGKAKTPQGQIMRCSNANATGDGETQTVRSVISVLSETVLESKSAQSHGFHALSFPDRNSPTYAMRR